MGRGGREVVSGLFIILLCLTARSVGRGRCREGSVGLGQCAKVGKVMELRVLVEESLGEDGVSRARLNWCIGDSWDVIWALLRCCVPNEEAGKIGGVEELDE